MPQAGYTDYSSLLQDALCNFAKPISQFRKEVKAKRDYRETTQHATHQAWRTIARHGKGEYLSWADRCVLVCLVNKWLYAAGRTGFIEPDHVALQKELNLSDSSITRAVRKLKSLGILVHIDGGRGRGHKAHYGVDLITMHQVLWPEFSLVTDEQAVSLCGEIKPVTYVRDYQRTKDMLSRKVARMGAMSRKIGGFWLGKGVDEDRVCKILTAMLAAGRSTFRNIPSGTDWKAKFGRSPKAGWSERLRDAHTTARHAEPSQWIIARLAGINPFKEQLA